MKYLLPSLLVLLLGNATMVQGAGNTYDVEGYCDMKLTIRKKDPSGKIIHAKTRRSRNPLQMTLDSQGRIQSGQPLNVNAQLEGLIRFLQDKLEEDKFDAFLEANSIHYSDSDDDSDDDDTPRPKVRAIGYISGLAAVALLSFGLGRLSKRTPAASEATLEEGKDNEEA